jgi:hypothetical protein
MKARLLPMRPKKALKACRPHQYNPYNFLPVKHTFSIADMFAMEWDFYVLVQDIGLNRRWIKTINQ